MDRAPVGFEAFKAWQRVPRAVRKSYATDGSIPGEDYAWAALGYARLALSGLGFAIYLGPAVLILVGFGVVMSAMDIGPDTFDIVVFVALLGFLTFNHVRVADRIRTAARRALGGRLG